jgi:N,N-dimethylformamidase beta subunit-like protein
VLRVWTGASEAASLRVFFIGRNRGAAIADEGLHKAPVTSWRRLLTVRTGLVIRFRIGDWPSGLYFAELKTTRGDFFAPFVVRPPRLGQSRVAVVLPTRTWQAYNRRDDNGDGVGDTWYENSQNDRVRLGRPFLDRGLPPYFRTYDLAFLQWLQDTGRGVEVLAQEDLDETTSAQLAAAYDLLVFPGHHEYVTEAEYDAVTEFRNRGGNLIFLSANNFFWRIDVENGVMTRVGTWRSLGRPEAGLVGVQYLGYKPGIRGRWLVRRHSGPTWLFAGVPLGNRGAFSSGGIEIDAIAPSSPPGTRVVAAIPNLLGPGMSAHMSYYRASSGAKVFAAGAFTLAGSVRQLAVRQLLANLWRRFARTVDTPSGLRPSSAGHPRVQAPAGALRGLVDTLQQYPAQRLASAFERAEAKRLLADIERTVEPWRSTSAAARAGFNTRRPKRVPGDTRVLWFHSEHRGFHSDDAYLDPRRPDTLIYADSPGRPLSLVGVMFSMPRGLEGVSPGGPITRWHWHEICTDTVKRGTQPLEGPTCSRGMKLYGGSEMLHVWFTGDLRSAYAIHAPVPELCKARLVPPDGCSGHHEHGM